MRLRALGLNENKLNAIFDSPESQQLLGIYESYYPKIGFIPPWIAYLILKNDKVVGTCSFTGSPKDGAVEIAYWTFKKFEGQGVSSFACAALISIVEKENPDLKVIAKTAPEHNASTKILEKNGFMFSKIVQDDDIGDAWLWIRNASIDSQNHIKS